MIKNRRLRWLPATVVALLITLGAAAPAAARFMVCAEQEEGGCVETSICHHFDDSGRWIGSVTIHYQC